LFSGRRRYLALWLPFLPTDRLHRQRRKTGAARDEWPLVVVARVKSALRLVHMDQAARGLGLMPGLTLADARARVPELWIEDDDPQADSRLHARLAQWCDCYTPLVGADGGDGLLLDITGCAHLFGGEAGLRADITARLYAFGFHARSALAGTPEAARALARFSQGGIVPEGGEAEAVRPLPVVALGIESDPVRALARAGLKKIADLADRPRAPLAARFGVDLLDRLEGVLGEKIHPISPRRPLVEKQVEQLFPEPIGRTEDMLAALQDLAGRLTVLMEQDGEGGRLFEASFFRADGKVRRIAVSTARPLRDPSLVARLFSERIESLTDPLDPGFGFDSIRLAALVRQARPATQAGLDGREAAGEKLAELVEHLAARLGEERIVRFEPQGSHIPERTACLRRAQASPSEESIWARSAAGEPPLQPLRLFDPPQPVDALAEVPDGAPMRFRWRRVTYEVAAAEGPERIAPEWWRREERPLTRDYFRVEDRDGRRFWLYREGLFGDEAQHPRWFLHGLFA